MKRLYAFFFKSLDFFLCKINSILERHCGFIMLSCNDDCLSTGQDITERPPEYKEGIEATNARNADRILRNALRTLRLFYVIASAIAKQPPLHRFTHGCIHRHSIIPPMRASCQKIFRLTLWSVQLKNGTIMEKARPFL